MIRGCFARVFDIFINSIWNILTCQQSILFSETLDTNIKAAFDAWAVCNSRADAGQSELRSPREELSDAALRAWVAANLLGEPFETLVEFRRAEGKSSNN